MSKRTLIALALVAAILIGCGSAAQPTPSPDKSPQPFMIALPRMAVNIDKAGNPSLLGLSPAMFGMDAKIPQELVDAAVAGDLQHVEVRMVGNGLMLFVDGKPVPHLAWDDQSLALSIDIGQAMTGQDLATIKKLLPVVRRLGLDVVLRFPRKAGTPEIPLISLEEGAKFAPQPSSGPATAVIKLNAKIDENGQLGLLDVTAEDLATLGVSLAPVLDAETLKRLEAANLQHLQVRTQPGGLFLYANGKPLPRVVWDSRLLTNGAETYGKLAPNSPFRELAKTVAPGIDRADVDVLVSLPRAAGAQPIPPVQP